MKGKIYMEVNNRNTTGSLYVSESVIERVVADAAKGVDGVEDIASEDKGALAKLLGRGNNTGITAELDGDVIYISAAVTLGADAPAFAVAEKVQTAIKSAVQNTLGLTVAKVDVKIAEAAL